MLGSCDTATSKCSEADALQGSLLTRAAQSLWLSSIVPRGTGALGISFTSMSSLQEPTREKNAVALSCQSCKTRKIKCDKGSPCSACAEHGRNCVPILRARLPRGRTKDRTNANGELKARLARLESLVSSLKNASGDQQAPPNGHDEHAHQVSSRLDSLTIDSTSPASQVTSNGQIGQPNWQWIADSHRWLGSTLWTQLGDQINGIHAVLEAEETEDDQLPGHNTVNGSPPEQDWITVDHSPSYQLHGSDSEPPLLSDHSKQAMIQLWVQRIDPVMKLIHEPSFTSYLRGASEYLDYVPGHPNVEALRAAVLYCCACSVTESESRSMFYLDRPDLIGIWRRYTEQCFAKADYIVSRDITMLQAMIYYLVWRNAFATLRHANYALDRVAHL